MKLKILNDILIIDILSVLLILSTEFVPSMPVRIILGLPFLLFFPGYTLVSSLFVEEEKMDGLERVALSGGVSIAVAGMIGFGLNYSPWGIRLEPLLYFIAAFILITSAIALTRRGRAWGTNRFTTEVTLRFPDRKGDRLNRSFSIILVVAIFGALGVLGYNVAAPRIGEKFTEFFVLGVNGKAQDYPTRFTVDNGKVTRVAYGEGAEPTLAQSGTVTVGIVNHQQESEVYFVRMTISGEAAIIESGGSSMGFLGPIELKQGEKWENRIGIVPQQPGEHQKVELLLFKGTEAKPDNSLHLWITVDQAK